MANYIEEYNVGGRGCGIEDLNSSGEHYLTEGKKRFVLWYGGCGIGSFETLSEARAILHTYLISQLMAEEYSAERKLITIKSSIERLSGDDRNLVRFEVPT